MGDIILISNSAELKVYAPTWWSNDLGLTYDLLTQKYVNSDIIKGNNVVTTLSLNISIVLILTHKTGKNGQILVKSVRCWRGVEIASMWLAAVLYHVTACM